MAGGFGASMATGGGSAIGSGGTTGGFTGSAQGGALLGGTVGTLAGGASSGGTTPTGGAPSGGGPSTGGSNVVGGAGGGSDGGSPWGAGGTASSETGGAGMGGSAGDPSATPSGGAAVDGGAGGGAGSSGDGGMGDRAGAGGEAESGTGGGNTGGADADLATIVPDPSWTCGMPDGVPPPTQGELVFNATLEIGDVHDVGRTQYGDRRLLDVTGGTFTGGRVQGTFLTGGLDLELTLANGAMEVEEIDILRASDGTPIYLRTCGFQPAGETKARVVLDFEVASSSSLAWLNDGAYAGTRIVDEGAGTIELAVYEVSQVAAGGPTIHLEDPAGVPNQPWECSTEGGSRGESVFTETVTLGSSISVGASKRGTRNIIPITGGTITGRITGSILPGGADYQLIGSGATLDARYTLATDDGEYILVRNCGPMGALIPLFETREEGSAAFLNANTFLSSDPGGAAGGVSITFYERN